MAMSKQGIPSGTARTASIIVLAFAVIFVLFGLSMFQAGSAAGAVAKDLQLHGQHGTVTDVRANIGRSDGRRHARQVELTFLDDDGSTHVMETEHFPHFYPPLNSKVGWVDDFSTKDEIVGQPVSYRLGESPAVELDSELAALANAGWSFPNYLGLALMVMGAGAAIGGIVSLLRAVRLLRQPGTTPRN